MTIDFLSQHNIHLIPKTINFDLIGKVDLEYSNNEFSTNIHLFTKSVPYNFPTSKPNSISELTSERFGYIIVENDNYIAHAIVEKRFNNTLYIEDFDVSSSYRRKNIATILMMRIENDARKEYRGLSLEVQDNNVIAFLFYIKYGFKIGGFDKLFYDKTIQKSQTAIYLYKSFE